MELIKDYDLVTKYHPRKANCVANALSRKRVNAMATMLASQLDLLCLKIIESINGTLANLNVDHSIIEEVKKLQTTNSTIIELQDKIKQGQL